MLGCHDGIPVLDLKGKEVDGIYNKGLLEDAEIENIMKKIILYILLLLTIKSFGQNRTCGSMENLAEQLEQFPEMRERMAEQ